MFKYKLKKLTTELFIKKFDYEDVEKRKEIKDIIFIFV
jgi:hypothetical protein